VTRIRQLADGVKGALRPAIPGGAVYSIINWAIILL